MAIVAQFWGLGWVSHKPLYPHPRHLRSSKVICVTSASVTVCSLFRSLCHHGMFHCLVHLPAPFSPHSVNIWIFEDSRSSSIHPFSCQPHPASCSSSDSSRSRSVHHDSRGVLLVSSLRTLVRPCPTTRSGIINWIGWNHSC